MTGIKNYALSRDTSNTKNEELTKTEGAPDLRKHFVINSGPAACQQVWLWDAWKLLIPPATKEAEMNVQSRTVRGQRDERGKPMNVPYTFHDEM